MTEFKVGDGVHIKGECPPLFEVVEVLENGMVKLEYLEDAGNDFIYWSADKLFKCSDEWNAE